MNNPSAQRFRDVTRVTLIGSLLDFLLGLFKVFLGIVNHSHALIADGVHSFSDLLTDFLVLIAARYSHAEPDAEHPYGHERFETFAVIILGTILIAIGGAIIFDGVDRLISKRSLFEASWSAIIVTILSIVSKEWIYRYTRRWGEKLNSDLIIANAWHSRSDSFSSIVVLVGIIGASLGYLWFDAVAAIIVALMIIYIGAELSWKSVKELVDTGISQDILMDVRKSVFSVDGVRGIHQLRTRRMGPHILLDLHLEVDPDITASEAHHIGVWVEQKLLNEFKDIQDVVFHIDHVGQKVADKKAILLPLRAQVIAALHEVWQNKPYINEIWKINLYYLEQKILVEVFLPIALLTQEKFDHKTFERDLEMQARIYPWFDHVRVCYALRMREEFIESE